LEMPRSSRGRFLEGLITHSDADSPIHIHPLRRTTGPDRGGAVDRNGR
jgi:hypothetical protein